MFKYLLKLELLRSREATFWFIVFPILLSLLLTSIFGNIKERVKFRIGVIGKSSILESFKEYFEIIEIKNLDEFLEKNLDIVVVLPQDFDVKVQKAIFLQRTKLFKPVDVDVYYVPGDMGSKIAKSVFVSVLSGVGNIKKQKIEIIEKNQKGRYQDFLYGAIIVMNIMSVTFFGYMTSISYYKRNGLLKRLSVTPYNHFYLTFTFVSFVQILISCAIFSVFDFLVYKVDVLDANILFYILYGSLVFLSFGYMLTRVIRNPETSVVLGNIFFKSLCLQEDFILM